MFLIAFFFETSRSQTIKKNQKKSNHVSNTGFIQPKGLNQLRVSSTPYLPPPSSSPRSATSTPPSAGTVVTRKRKREEDEESTTSKEQVDENSDEENENDENENENDDMPDATDKPSLGAALDYARRQGTFLFFYIEAYNIYNKSGWRRTAATVRRSSRCIKTRPCT